MDGSEIAIFKFDLNMDSIHAPRYEKGEFEIMGESFILPTYV